MDTNVIANMMEGGLCDYLEALGREEEMADMDMDLFDMSAAEYVFC